MTSAELFEVNAQYAAVQITRTKDDNVSEIGAKEEFCQTASIRYTMATKGCYEVGGGRPLRLCAGRWCIATENGDGDSGRYDNLAMPYLSFDI